MDPVLTRLYRIHRWEKQPFGTPVWIWYIRGLWGEVLNSEDECFVVWSVTGVAEPLQGRINLM
jgi:hypothetical protein